MTARIMPKRWFYGSTGNSMLSGLTTEWKGDRRPLLPGERYLGKFIIPTFQRPMVWTERQKVRLIESIYIGMPIGAIVWNQCVWPKAENQTDGWLLDGQQRMSAIIGFMADEFAVAGHLWSGLPTVEHSHFLRNSIPYIETDIHDPDQCRDVYERLVYGGTVHEPVSVL